MNLVLYHEKEGGWVCAVAGCGFSCFGATDAETHAEREHGAESFMDENLDIWDVKELSVEILRSAGAI